MPTLKSLLRLTFVFMKREFPEMGYSKSTYRNSLTTTKKNVALNLSYSAQTSFDYRFK